jgi:hypothetical protein
MLVEVVDAPAGGIKVNQGVRKQKSGGAKTNSAPLRLA